MKRIVFVTICLLSLTTVVNAQMKPPTPVDDPPLPLTQTEFTVNGLSPDNTYTLAQMKAAFGDNPSFESNRQNESGTTHRLRYGDDYFSFSTEFGWTVFVLRTNAYPVVVNGITFRVGDNISILPTIPHDHLILKEAGLYYLYIDIDDPIKVRFNSSNIITRISFSASI